MYNFAAPGQLKFGHFAAMSRIRFLILVLHRWIGLASSLLLSIVGVTGAVLVLPSRVLPGGAALRNTADLLHTKLGMGNFGWWVVVVVTIAAIFIELGGLYLWWKRKTISVRVRSGWKLAVFDLHHAFGLFALPLMLLLAVSGAAMPFVTPENQLWFLGVIVEAHTPREFSPPIKLLYMLGSTGFLLQGVTGVLMWWKPRRHQSI